MRPEGSVTLGTYEVTVVRKLEINYSQKVPGVEITALQCVDPQHDSDLDVDDHRWSMKFSVPLDHHLATVSIGTLISFPSAVENQTAPRRIPLSRA